MTRVTNPLRIALQDVGFKPRSCRRVMSKVHRASSCGTCEVVFVGVEGATAEDILALYDKLASSWVGIEAFEAPITRIGIRTVIVRAAPRNNVPMDRAQ